jgi:aspartate aminotransferase-like enzyme
MLRMAEPLIHHRSAEFRTLLSRVTAHLRYLFQTDDPVLTLTCSGTGGVEATFVSLFSPGETVIVLNGGKFGERWVQMARAFGLEVVEIRTPWGAAADPPAVASALREHPHARGVYVTHCETSTGTANDVREIARIVRENSRALVCVDGISSVGALELRCGAWGVDVCVTGSQKGLMIPPGLAFVSLGERAVRAASQSKMPRYYFDLGTALRALERGDTSWTPAIALVQAADASLAMIRGEGMENIWSRHARLAGGLRAGVAALGLTLFSSSPSNSVTAVRLPGGVEWNAFAAALRKGSGVTFAGGQAGQAGRIFRVGHLGYIDEPDILTAVAAVERALSACGVAVDRGAGLRAAEEEFFRLTAHGGSK